MNHILRNVLLTALAAAAASCTKSAEEEANVAASRYLDAWRAINYPSAVEKDGIYIIEDRPGTGLEWRKNLSVNFLTYTVRSLGGTVSANTDEDWARQLGTWNKTYYYGPQVAITGENLSYAGVDILLDGMRLGGTRTAIIPSWLMTYSRYDKAEEYFRHETENSPAIYTVTLLDQTENLPEYEFRNLQAYASDKWKVSDTLSTAAVFFKSHSEDLSRTVQLPADTTVYINYTGRRVHDGQVFDTNVADTAKLYNIYNPAKTYEPVAVYWSDEAGGITMGVERNSTVKGFSHGLYAMHANEKASFAFGYLLGYGSSGSGNLVPPYAALQFDIELVPKP